MWAVGAILAAGALSPHCAWQMRFGSLGFRPELLVGDMDKKMSY
jgi:hypothetical protein